MSPPSWASLPFPSPCYPSGLFQSPRLSSLSHTANSHRLSIFHMIMYISMLFSPYIPLSTFPHPTPCPYVCSREAYCYRLACAQLCLTLCDLMDYSQPGSSVHEIFQEDYWSGLPFPPQGFFPTQRSNPYLVPPILASRFFTTEPTGKPVERCSYLLPVTWPLLVFWFKVSRWLDCSLLFAVLLILLGTVSLNMWPMRI